MGTKHPNPNFVKIHLSYSVDEIARRLNVSKGTVRRWIKTGLETVGGRGKTIVRGSVVREFLKQRRARLKRPCGPGHLYCLGCRSPREPAGRKAELVLVRRGGSATTIGTLRGICPDCSALMFRHVSLARLDAARGNLEIAFPEALPRLGGIPSPSPNDDSSKEQPEHEIA
jgi:hypothetical protein